MNALKKYGLGIFLLTLVAGAGYLIYVKLHPKKLPPNLIEAVGRFDGDIIHLNSKYPGRIVKQNAEDGKKIAKNQLITQIDSKEFNAKKEAIKNQIEAKKRELEIAKNSLPQNVKKAQASLKASLAAKKELLNSIEALKAVVEQNRRDYRRLLSLYKQKLIQKHEVEVAALKLKTNKKKLDSLMAKLKEVEAKIEAAKSTLAQAKSSLKKIEALKFAIEALNSKLKEIEAILEELKLRSPIDGFVLEKVANVGEVVGAGAVSATLLDPASLYLKIFIDTINVGKVKIGDKGVIFLDAYPNRPFEARVVRIAKKAEFTPKEVAVRHDRIQRVYAVHLKPIKPNPLFKIGLPAIGVISIDGKGLPKSMEEIPPL